MSMAFKNESNDNKLYEVENKKTKHSKKEK
jgi:hypothetical protein